MMIKFLLGIAIVAFTSFCGYVLTKKYRRRKLFFTQLYQLNERFLNEISYYRRPLTEFFLAGTYKGEFYFLIEDFLEKISKRQAIQGIAQSNEFDFLSKDEKEFVGNYFSMLGKGDSVSQKNYFSSLKEQLKKYQTDAETQNKKYGDLYIKLGFLLGLLILILIL